MHLEYDLWQAKQRAGKLNVTRFASTSSHKLTNMERVPLVGRTAPCSLAPAMRGEGWGEGPLAAAEAIQWSPKVPLHPAPARAPLRSSDLRQALVQVSCVSVKMEVDHEKRDFVGS
jgi:hypothetical protein